MRQASVELIGTHDYRNFCKLDITNTEPTFIRRIDKITIEQLNTDNDFNSNNSGSVFILFLKRKEIFVYL